MRLRPFVVVVLAFAALVSQPRFAAADEPAEPAPAEPSTPAPPETQCAPGWESVVFATARGSVVRIANGGGWGAGFAWKSPRRIVTAMHVVERARAFDVVFGDGSKGRAHLVAGDRRSDVAILELDGKAAALTPLELGDPSAIPLGAPVIAIGHPLAREKGADSREEGLRTWTITRGVLGARNDYQIQVDAPLNPGNSGGPILDCTGRVIGVASHVSGSLGFASGPREILDLDQNPRTPGISYAPTSIRPRVGLSTRISDFTAYGPLLDLEVSFFDTVHLMARVTGLFSLTSEVQGDRVVTSRTGVHLFAGAGYEFRVFRFLRVLPHAGVAFLRVHENATRFDSGKPLDDSTGRGSVRAAPGLALTLLPFTLDYKMEIDVGSFGDSAHLASLSYALF